MLRLFELNMPNAVLISSAVGFTSPTLLMDLALRPLDGFFCKAGSAFACALPETSSSVFSAAVACPLIFRLPVFFVILLLVSACFLPAPCLHVSRQISHAPRSEIYQI